MKRTFNISSPPSLSMVLRDFNPALSTGEATAAQRPIGGTHPDHQWNPKTDRWHDVDGKMLPGGSPPEKE